MPQGQVKQSIQDFFLFKTTQISILNLFKTTQKLVQNHAKKMTFLVKFYKAKTVAIFLSYN